MNQEELVLFFCSETTRNLDGRAVFIYLSITTANTKKIMGDNLSVIDSLFSNTLQCTEFIRFWSFPNRATRQVDPARWSIHGRLFVPICPVCTTAFPGKHHVQLRRMHPPVSYKYVIRFCSTCTTHREQPFYVRGLKRDGGLSNAVHQTLNVYRII
jgi:hypothetical protein